VLIIKKNLVVEFVQNIYFANIIEKDPVVLNVNTYLCTVFIIKINIIVLYVIQKNIVFIIKKKDFVLNVMEKDYAHIIKEKQDVKNVKKH
jgi:hypothetical protein